MSDNLLNFEEHRRRREESPSLVRCAHCGEPILATVTRCPECGVHFQGEAYEFSHPSALEQGDESGLSTRMLIFLLLLTALVLGVLLIGA